MHPAVVFHLCKGNYLLIQAGIELNAARFEHTKPCKYRAEGVQNSCKYRTEGGAKMIATELKGCKNPCNITEGVAKIFATELKGCKNPCNKAEGLCKNPSNRAEGVAKILATELKGLQKSLQQS